MLFNDPADSLESARVPAIDVVHLFEPERPTQRRGVPLLASEIIPIYDFDGYGDAERVRKRVAANHGGFIIRREGPARMPAYGGKPTTDERGQMVVPFEPGMFVELPAQYSDVKFADPADVGPNYAPWIKNQLREIATGGEILYEDLSGDYEGVTFVSIRAARMRMRRRIEQIQHFRLIFQWVRPINGRFLDYAVASGAYAVNGPYARVRGEILSKVKMQPQGWEYVNPVDDVTARVMARRAGQTSTRRILMEKGLSLEEVWAEIKEENELAKRDGLVLDSDPAQVDQAGTEQTQAVAGGSLANPAARG
jgi:lambda family phage portal protein